MKAYVYEKYGPPDVLQLREVEKPTPKENELLVKIHAASVNALDWHMLTADIFLVRLMTKGLLRPKRTCLGADIAGQVEAVGSGITQFRPGDEVFGDVFGHSQGGFAEYVAVPESALAPKPTNLSFKQAAAVPVAGLTALQGLRSAARVQPGEKVLIYGAAGGVGTFAVQIARAFGAEVTAVCSTRNLEQARSLGAHNVIDYTKEDFSKNGRKYDVILGVNGFRPISVYKNALAPGGRYVMAGGSMGQIFQAMLLGPLLSRGADKKLSGLSAKTKQEDLLALKDLLEAGKVTPIIDRSYPLEQVPEALRYLGSGHARAKIVITIDSSER
jgi:NADPH:quinone reductase-like Zn-dependent oxidoreductase